MFTKRTLIDLTTPLASEGQPHLFGALQELCHKAKIEMPNLHLLDHGKLGTDHVSNMLRVMPAATFHQNGQHHIYFNEPMLKIWGMDNITSPMTDEVKAVISHELGHITRKDIVGFGAGRVAQFTPLACLVGGLGVTAYLEHRSKQQEKEKPALKIDTSQSKSPTLNAALIVGEYVGAAILGLTVGMVIATKIRHGMEYSCDAFSKKLMGSGEPLAIALEKLHQFENRLINDAIAAGKISEQQAQSLKSVDDFIKNLMHPPQEARIAALRR
jgi:Zn-dependent protease with chaperone function